MRTTYKTKKELNQKIQPLHNLSLRYYLIKSKPKLKLVVTAQYPPII